MELISWVWRCWQRQTYGINAGNTEGWFLHIFDNAKGCSQITDGRPDGIPRPLIFDEIGTGVFFFFTFVINTQLCYLEPTSDLMNVSICAFLF